MVPAPRRPYGRSPQRQRGAAIARRKDGLMDRFIVGTITLTVAMVLLAESAGAAGPPAGPLTRCPADSVVSGAGCMDKYEASVWGGPNPTKTKPGRGKRIQPG